MSITLGSHRGGTTRTVVDTFVSDPVDFMTNNLVVTPEGGGNLNIRGVKWFTLTVLPSTARSVERPGATIKCYQAHPTAQGSGNGVFECYWCPYEDNTLQTTTVGNLANIMFTAPMNGCSFGIGSATGDGSRLVGHANLKSTPGGRSTQNKVLKVGKMTEGLVDPDIYMSLAGNDPVLVTTFGVRDPSTKSWSFYYQLSTSATGTQLIKTLIGVYPVL